MSTQDASDTLSSVHGDGLERLQSSVREAKQQAVRTSSDSDKLHEQSNKNNDASQRLKDAIDEVNQNGSLKKNCLPFQLMKQSRRSTNIAGDRVRAMQELKHALNRWD